ncbi:MAG: hypothetical protein AAGH40_12965 [Verrucomicrobiota bacterium]
MSKSIRISDELAEKAAEAARLFHRSPPQQIEHWAQIGQVMEAALSYPAQRRVAQWGRDTDIDDLINESQSAEGQAKLRTRINQSSGGEYWEVAAEQPQSPYKRAEISNG